MSLTDLDRFKAACDYPATLDVAAVETHLHAYLSALGVERKIVRLEAGWRIDDHPSLRRYVDLVLDDIEKRSPNARDARDARAALDARAARAALDARDALTSIQRFAAWCVQSLGWWYWRFDLSWISTAHFGAMQLQKPAVGAWASPLFEAFIAGCWLLHFTDDTLYWVAKPIVHVERGEGFRRLHCVDGPALESDCENLYFWRGVMVPAFVIVKPEWITIKHIQTEDNAEVRRVMIERYGEGRYIVDSGMKPIAHDEVFGTLYESPLKDAWPSARILRVVNRSPEPDGTFKPYWLDVNGEHYNGDAGRIPQAAVASTWRTKPGGEKLAFKMWQDYAPMVET